MADSETGRVEALERKCAQLQAQLAHMMELFDASQRDMRTFCAHVVARDKKVTEERRSLEEEVHRLEGLFSQAQANQKIFADAVAEMDYDIIQKVNTHETLIYQTNNVLRKMGKAVLFVYNMYYTSPEVQEAVEWAYAHLVALPGALVCSFCLTRAFMGEPVGSVLPLGEESIVVTQNIESALITMKIPVCDRIEDDVHCTQCRRQGSVDWPCAFYVPDHDISAKRKRTPADARQGAFKRARFTE